MALPSDHGQQGVGIATNVTPAEDFKQLLTKQERFAPLPDVLAAAEDKDYQALYDEAASDLAGSGIRSPKILPGSSPGRASWKVRFRRLAGLPMGNSTLP